MVFPGFARVPTGSSNMTSRVTGGNTRSDYMSPAARRARASADGCVTAACRWPAPRPMPWPWPLPGFRFPSARGRNCRIW